MSIHQLQFGRITTLTHHTGIVNDFNKKTFTFDVGRISSTLKKGQLVAFQVRRKEAYNLQFAYISKDKRLIIDRKDSHLHEGVQPFLKTACAHIHCGHQKQVTQQINFTKTIGFTNCVPTSSKDVIKFAIRKGRKGYSRFVLHRQPLPTKSMTVVLKQKATYYSITTAYLGTRSAVEPWDKQATKQAFHFWNNHAFVLGSEPIKEHTLTEECKW